MPADPPRNQNETTEPEPTSIEYWYRYEDVQYASPLDEDGFAIGKGDLRIELRQYRVLRVTPRGVQLEAGYRAGRFVLNDSRKRFACSTKEEALVSFIARKTRQVGIYHARLKQAEKVLLAAKRGIIEKNLNAMWNFESALRAKAQEASDD